MSTNAIQRDLDFDLVLEDGVPLKRWNHRLQPVLLDLATGRFEHHRSADPHSLSDDRVYALPVDSVRRLWIGTYGSPCS